MNSILKSVVYPRHLKKEIRIQSHIAKSYRPVNICKTPYSRHDFWTNFWRKFGLFLNFLF